MSLIPERSPVIEKLGGGAIRFSYRGESCTGRPEQFAQVLFEAFGKDDETLILTVDRLPRHGRDWIRYQGVGLGGGPGSHRKILGDEPRY
jgi:hypothetical protein